jgi:hypothetical protein
MDLDLLPSVSLQPRSFNALVAPRELFIQALNRNLDLQRYKVLYICGNYSGILILVPTQFPSQPPDEPKRHEPSKESQSEALL